MIKLTCFAINEIRVRASTTYYAHARSLVGRIASVSVLKNVRYHTHITQCFQHVDVILERYNFCVIELRGLRGKTCELLFSIID